MNDNRFNDDRTDREAENIDRVRVSVDLDQEILEQIKHLTNNPSRVIEAAIKQWLRGERNDNTDLTRTFQRNPPVPPQGEWND
ncbi:MAG: type II toxin-antitoxin system CcdA family antitoxin [Cyanobacteria bacterium J06623_7]